MSPGPRRRSRRTTAPMPGPWPTCCPWGRTAWWSKRPATTAACSPASRRSASGCWVSSRLPTSPSWPRLAASRLNRCSSTVRREPGCAPGTAAPAVIGNNVLAPADERAGVSAAAHAPLSAGGLVIIEVPYLAEMFDRIEYDTVYHEHLSYFSVTSLMGLARSAGLSVIRVDRVAVHGGSLRMYAGRREDHPTHGSEVLKLADAEREAGLTSLERWQRFAAEVEGQRAALRALLDRLRAEGKRLAAYGAPAKGTTMLNYCGIGPDLIPFTVDRNPLKVGTLMPGTHIPVAEVGEILKQQPDYLLILPWNFAPEIMDQQSEYRRRGGQFILPIPDPRIVA